MFVEYGGIIDPYINSLAEAGLTMNFDSDVAAAQALIEGNGYALNDAGIYAKDGAELGIDIQTHEGFIEKRRIAENVVEQWRHCGHRRDADQRGRRHLERQQGAGQLRGDR